MKKAVLLFVGLMAVLCLSTYGDGNFPKMINYQGMLTQSDGKTPVQDGTYHLTFKIYGSPSGDDSLWTEHHLDVLVTNGLFNVILGSITPLDLPFDTLYWLGIKVGDDTELSPRIQLTSVGYAFHAQKADTANIAVLSGSGGGWVDDEEVVRLETNTDRVGIGTNSPKERVQVGNQITIHDGDCKFLGFNYYWDGSSNRRIVGGPAGRLLFCWGDLILEVADSNMADSEISETNLKRVRLNNNGTVEIPSGLGLSRHFGPDPNYISTGGSYIAFGDPYVSEDFIGYKNNTFYFKDSPGGADISDPNMVVGGNVGIGTNNPSRKLTVRGNILIESASSGNPIVELGEGLDYAEGFDVSDHEHICPGAVLVIDPSHPGKLAVSREPYDNKVAGIVAGAKDLGSGVRLGADQFDHDVALAGRVYCNVDATEAGIEPGDLLTTSATPGYAMKARDRAQAKGAILGKAMERLEKGQKGQILVLVTLQ